MCEQVYVGRGPELIQLPNVPVFFGGDKKAARAGTGCMDLLLHNWAKGGHGLEQRGPRGQTGVRAHVTLFAYRGVGECILSWRIISIRMQTQQECAKAGAKHLSTIQQRIGLSGAKDQKLSKKWP